ncbi:LamG-like jellyroll fold domain-containing protein [Lacinutrix chionoecetis]
MKNFTLKTSLLVKFVLFGLILSQTINAQVDIADYNFDTGTDGWIDGGTYANHTTSNTYRCNAAGAIFVRYSHNLDTSSRFTSPNIDLTPYTSVDFSFCFTSLRIDNNEGFDLQYFDGTTWTTLETYRRGTEFAQSNSTPQTFTFTLDNATYSFNANSAFRFIGRCSSTNEYAVFDDINIDGYGVTGTEINITGSGNTIVSGDTTPDLTDDTDFGTTFIGSPVSHTFTIQNLGSSALNIGAISFTGSSAAEFSVTSAPSGSVAAGGNTTFVVEFNPTGTGTRPATISIANNDSTGGENPYTFALQGYVETSPPEFTIFYENFDENNGSWVASTGSTTNWAYGTGLTTVSEIGEGNYWYTDNYNNYSANAYTTVESPIISTIGYNNLFFTVDLRYDLNADQDDGMIVEYRKRTLGLFWSPWTILGANGDGANWYDGNGNVDAIASGSDGWTGNTYTTQAIQNFFETSEIQLPTILDNSAEIQFRFVFASDGDGTTDNGVAFDNVMILADPILAFPDPTVGPGSINSDLKLWLKATSQIGTSTDGADINTWNDQAFDNNGIGLTTNSPSFEDNVTENINFNPVIKFDRANQEYMRGKGGYYSKDYFIVIKPNGTIDNGGGNRMAPLGGRASKISPQVDGTGLGLGNISARFTDEVVAHMKSSVPTNTPTAESYGRAFTSTTDSYVDEVIIFNIKTNPSGTGSEIYKNGIKIDNTLAQTQGTPVDLLFSEFFNQQYYLGIGRFSLNGNVDAYVDGKITEVISYKNTNSVLDQQKIQSYLAIKNGVTLHTSNSSTVDNLNDVDYIDSNGNVIWDTSANNGYNYDIAGIGRDDASQLYQKQSSSSNDAVDANGPIEGILTMGLTDIYNTNSENNSINTNTINDRNFLVWGNNNASLDAAPVTVAVDMSSGIPGLSTPVDFLGMQRIWKVVENGGDIGEVKVSIPQNAVRNINPPGNYYMFISDTPVFDPTADYRLMRLNDANLEATYNFDGTKYITFGYAPQTIVERSIYFDGAQDYIDMEDALNLNPTGFTVSAWIKRDSRDVSILSKRDAVYSEGYDLSILNNRRLRMSWGLLGANFIDSSVQIPENEWHQVAVTYDGTTAKIYIDGVIDTTKNLTAPTPTTQSFFIAAAGKIIPTAHFRGNIDEVRVWDVELSPSQLQFIMNQEIEENAGFVNGTVLPSSITKNDIAIIPWNELAGYYPMSIYTYTNTDDASGNGNQGALRNLNTVDYQTAPLPYKSTVDGDWNTNASWLNGNLQTIPGTTSIVDNTVTVDWNIVETSHNITMDNSTLPVASNNNRAVLALDVKASELILTGDTELNTGNGLTISHYLSLDGKIDLNGESQLIQLTDSDLKTTSTGTLERDQQGTQDLFTYNYWSSPVGVSNSTSNNNSYTVPQIFNDGSDVNAPLNINFITNSYDGTPSASGTPIGIADFWIWKYANLGTSYYNWQHVRSTGSLNAGEGFTMKGVNNTSNNLSLTQNYILEGKPNNGDITLPIDASSDYLVGNPYASAIDANRFILDNTNTTGAIYLWEHFGGGTHNTSGYQGGYAVYNLSGGVPAIKYDYNTGNNDTSGGTGSKTPGRYIPVAQGFFVTGTSTGTINFNNNQRIFRKEGPNSVFLKNNESSSNFNNNDTDNRLKIRLSLETVNTFKRQLLVTRDSQATDQVDFAFDAENTEGQANDMFWMIDNKKFVIQGTDVIDDATILPIGIKTNQNGIVTFKIDALENVPLSLEIYIFDTVTNTYFDIKNNPEFTIDLTAGEYLDRFELRFSNGNSLSTEEFDAEDTGIQFYFANSSDNIVINNPEFEAIKSVELFNVIGQSIVAFNDIETESTIELKTNNIATGAYILVIKTNDGELSKKVLIE